MDKKDLMKLVCEEMVETVDNKEIKCPESYLMGFRSGLYKMSAYITQSIVKEAKQKNIELPKELKEFYESLQNSQARSN